MRIVHFNLQSLGLYNTPCAAILLAMSFQTEPRQSQSSGAGSVQRANWYSCLVCSDRLQGLPPFQSALGQWAGGVILVSCSCFGLYTILYYLSSNLIPITPNFPNAKYFVPLFPGSYHPLLQSVLSHPQPRPQLFAGRLVS